MKLGCFSLSLNVKDIYVSLAFYEKLGFEVFHGNADQGWLILSNADTKIGLFQGMLDNNIMAFNPGWDANATPLDDYLDIRDIQKRLKRMDVKLDSEVDETETGPASFTLKDPDGNLILIDQHV